ncbi:hypothetical protein DFAR_220006 [Desulfarculales bacterium]
MAWRWWPPPYITHTMPATHEERLALAALIVQEAGRRGIEGPHLYMDPMVLPLSLAGGETQASAALAILRACARSSPANVFSPRPNASSEPEPGVSLCP